MGETKVVQTPKKSWFKGLKGEFNKITWPDKIALVKQTTAVVAISVLLGAIITVIDVIIKYGVDLLVK